MESTTAYSHKGCKGVTFSDDSEEADIFSDGFNFGFCGSLGNSGKSSTENYICSSGFSSSFFISSGVFSTTGT